MLSTRIMNQTNVNTEYMKKFISISLFISACFPKEVYGILTTTNESGRTQTGSKTIGDYEAQAETLTKQLTSLSSAIGSSFITLISQDAIKTT